MIVEVDGLGAQRGTRLRLRGPGIESSQSLSVGGLSHEFRGWREGLQAAMPRGIDLILVDGARIAAVPRTSLTWRITLEA